METHVFIAYVAIGATLAAYTIRRIKTDLKYNPQKQIDFQAALMLVPRKSERILLTFVGLLLLFAWPPIVAKHIYKNYKRACESVVLIGFTAYVVFTLSVALWDNFSDPGACSYHAPSLGSVLLPIILLALLIAALVYILHRCYIDNPHKPSPKEPHP